MQLSELSETPPLLGVLGGFRGGLGFRSTFLLGTLAILLTSQLCCLHIEKQQAVQWSGGIFWASLIPMRTTEGIDLS